MEALLPIENVIAAVGFGRSWIYREVANGNFPAPIKIGRSTRWRASDVEAWIDQQAASVMLATFGPPPKTREAITETESA